MTLRSLTHPGFLHIRTHLWTCWSLLIDLLLMMSLHPPSNRTPRMTSTLARDVLMAIYRESHCWFCRRTWVGTAIYESTFLTSGESLPHLAWIPAIYTNEQWCVPKAGHVFVIQLLVARLHSGHEILIIGPGF